VNSQNLSYQLGYTQFADLTTEEFEKTILVDPTTLQEQVKFLNQRAIDFDTLADEDDNLKSQTITQATVDWSSQMNPVRDQGSCGNCWDFAGVGSIEHAIYRSGNSNTSYLSVQQVSDCAPNLPRGGCHGAAGHTALDFSINTGIVRDTVYPWTSGNGIPGAACLPISNSAERIRISKYTTLPQNVALSAFLSTVNQGATVVLVYATNLSLYKSGIWAPTDCETVNHAVVAVGYRYDSNNNLIIKVRNSWANTFGVNGYFEVYYNASTSTCGITGSGGWFPTM